MKRKKNGQTLIEAVVALGILLVIIAAIATVMISGLYNAQYIKNQNEAGKLAQEGIELVRNIQKNNLELFKSYVGSATYYCINPQTSNLYFDSSCNENSVNTGIFSRTIQFVSNDSDCNNGTIPNTVQTRVTVRVKWNSSKCPANNFFCHKSELITCLPYKNPESNP